MSRRTLARLVLASCLVPLLAQSARTAPVPDDEAEIQGTWNVTKAERGGEATEEPVGGKIVLEKGMIRIIHKDSERKENKGTYKIDPKQAPKHLTLTPAEEENAEAKEFLCIYHLKGDDLTLCIAGPDEDRPKELKSPAESRIMLLVLKREKP